MNCKRKSRRRFFLLVRSRTPPISSEFRGGGFEHPKPPLSVRHWLPLHPRRQTYDTFDWTFSQYRDAASCLRSLLGSFWRSVWKFLHLQVWETPARCASSVVDVRATGTKVVYVEFAVIPQCWQLLHSHYTICLYKTTDLKKRGKFKVWIVFLGSSTLSAHCMVRICSITVNGVPKGEVWGVQTPPPQKKIPKISVESSIAWARRTGVSISFCSSLCSHTVVIY